MQQAFYFIDDQEVEPRETKCCIKCKEEKPLSEFYEMKTRGSSFIRNECYDCLKQLVRDRYHIRKTAPPIPECCESCGDKFSIYNKPVLDHCHATSSFRGWLCPKCNVGMGHFQDDPAMLEKAIDYLKRTDGR